MQIARFFKIKPKKNVRMRLSPKKIQKLHSLAKYVGYWMEALLFQTASVWAVQLREKGFNTWRVAYEIASVRIQNADWVTSMQSL